MRAAVVTELNGPDGVVIREVPDPTPGTWPSPHRRGIRGHQLSRRPPDPGPIPSAPRIAVYTRLGDIRCRARRFW